VANQKAMSSVLRNLIPQLHQFSLNGQPVIVKNTFVDVAEAEQPEPLRKRGKSAPSRRSKDMTVDDEPSTPSDGPLHEVRRRVFTECLERETFDDDTSTPLVTVEAFCAPVPTVEAFCAPLPTVEAFCAPTSTKICSHLDNFDSVEVMSNASTQLPASSIGTSFSRGRFNSDLTDTAIMRVPLSLDSFVNGGKAPAAAVPPVQDSSDRTTLMFRNLPQSFTRQKLERLMDAEGFGVLYDFIYLPAELGTGSCFGYAFINMVTAQDAERFVEYFQGFDRWEEADTRRAVVHLSEALQGLNEQIERYRNSPLMHPSVSDDLRPAVYRGGVRVPFPEPTAPIRPPRMRTSTKKKAPFRKAAMSDL